MQEVASEINQMKRVLSYPAFVTVKSEPFPTGDQFQKDARGWISPPDPSKNHVIARRSYQGESAVWFTGGSIFNKWSVEGGLLWIHGKRTCFLTASIFY